MMGTKDGDVIVTDAGDNGRVRGRFPAHRSIAIDFMRVEPRLGILITVAGRHAKFWHMPAGFALTDQIKYPDQVTCCAVMGDLLLTGHKNGGVRVVKMYGPGEREKELEEEMEKAEANAALAEVIARAEAVKKNNIKTTAGAAAAEGHQKRPSLLKPSMGGRRTTTTTATKGSVSFSDPHEGTPGDDDDDDDGEVKYAPKLAQGSNYLPSSKHFATSKLGGGGAGGDTRLRQGDGETDRDGYKALVQPVGLAGDHTGPVTFISPHTKLGHFVTCGVDGTVKIFDSKKRLERSLVMGQPLSCVSHLNDAGDVLVGMDDKLVVIRTATYAAEVDIELRQKQSAILADWDEAVKKNSEGGKDLFGVLVDPDLARAVAGVKATLKDTVVSTTTSVAAIEAARRPGGDDDDDDGGGGDGDGFPYPDVPVDPAEEEEVQLTRYKVPGDVIPFPSSSGSSDDEEEEENDGGSSDDDDEVEEEEDDDDDEAVMERLKALDGLDDLANELENLDLEQLKKLIGENGAGGMAAVGMLAGGGGDGGTRKAGTKGTKKKKKKKRKKVKATGEKALKHAKDFDIVVGLQEYQASDSMTFKLENSMRPRKVVL